MFFDLVKVCLILKKDQMIKGIMKKIKNAIILSPDDHRYSNSYRFYCSSIPGGFKSGDLFSVEWHSLDDRSKALAIFNREDFRFKGVNRVDKKGRMNFTPPEWVFPKTFSERKVNYGRFNKNEFMFGDNDQ